jgi:hypothetical protein
LLHGLTFDQGTWSPIVDRLDGAVTSIAVDQAAHGGIGGEPMSLQAVARAARPPARCPDRGVVG